jgi:hypothetical protein
MRRATIVLVVIACLAVGTRAQAHQDLENRLPRSVFLENAVVAWNQVAYDLGFAEDQFLTFKGVRAHAMMNVAMHDALNAVVPVYRPYAHRRHAPRAHPIAAVARSAHDVLLSQYPGERARLRQELARWLGRVPDGPRKTRGIALGRNTAVAILALRAGDGWDFQGTYTFDPALGAYQTTPPWNGFVVQPGFRFARPFGLRTAGQLRPPPPPPLDSATYATAYNEVREFGRADSRVRTQEQTRYALWWMEFTEGSMNRLARNLVSRQHTHLWRAARMFALLNMSMFDGYLANWDSKYTFNHWRPYTAVRAAADDGNPDTEPDVTWQPLRTTPPHPEYVSAHSTVCGSSFEILRRTFGDNFGFTMDTTSAPPGMPTRSFSSFRSAAAECADSRVRIGWHFRYATDSGLALGRGVAAYVAAHHLAPHQRER